MKITEVTASFGQTIQFQQYEPVNVHISLKAEVEEGEVGATAKLSKAARSIVEKEISALKDERAALDEITFADDIPKILEAIAICKTKEDLVTLWENTETSLRRIDKVRAAFKGK